MNWARMLAYITGTVDQELLVRNEYLAAENRILKAQVKGRLLLSEADKATLAEIAHRLGRKALEEVAATAMPDTCPSSQSCPAVKSITSQGSRQSRSAITLVAMFDLFRLWLGAVLRGFRTRRSLMLENLALRQQLPVFKRQQPRPRLGAIDKLFWVVARRFWAHWKKAVLIVLPDTVARWHRSGFKLYWAILCKVRKPVGGGRRISQQIRELIFQMVADNPSWGAPRIHGELRMLGRQSRGWGQAADG